MRGDGREGGVFYLARLGVTFILAAISIQGSLCEGGMYSIYQSADLAMFELDQVCVTITLLSL